MNKEVSLFAIEEVPNLLLADDGPDMIFISVKKTSESIRITKLYYM